MEHRHEAHVVLTARPDEVVFLTTRDTYEPHNVDDRKYFELNNFSMELGGPISDSSELNDQCS